METTFEEMAGGTMSINSSFRNAATTFPTAKATAMYWLHVDDLDVWDRFYVSVYAMFLNSDVVFELT
jgi:hypothetical protein